MDKNTCPKCRTTTLLPLQSASALTGLVGLPQRCPRCHGFWVKVSTIAALSSSGALSAVDEDTVRAESDKKGGLCPEGHGILARAKASWSRPFYVERCMVCAGIWLDAGEWKRLSAEHLLENLEDLWVPTWRRHMQQEHHAAQLQEMLTQRLGPELLKRIEDLANELASHEQADLGFAVLRETFEKKRPKRARR